MPRSGTKLLKERFSYFLQGNMFELRIRKYFESGVLLEEAYKLEST